jgi:hypothetical protein
VRTAIGKKEQIRGWKKDKSSELGDWELRLAKLMSIFAAESGG